MSKELTTNCRKKSWISSRKSLDILKGTHRFLMFKKLFQWYCFSNKMSITPEFALPPSIGYNHMKVNDWEQASLSVAVLWAMLAQMIN